MSESQVRDPVSGVYGKPWEVIHCRGFDRQGHEADDCDACGGSGYRAICNRTICHEYGCQAFGCARTEDDWRAQGDGGDA